MPTFVATVVSVARATSSKDSFGVKVAKDLFAKDSILPIALAIASQQRSIVQVTMTAFDLQRASRLAKRSQLWL